MAYMTLISPSKTFSRFRLISESASLVIFGIASRPISELPVASGLVWHSLSTTMLHTHRQGDNWGCASLIVIQSHRWDQIQNDSRQSKRSHNPWMAKNRSLWSRWGVGLGCAWANWGIKTHPKPSKFFRGQGSITRYIPVPLIKNDGSVTWFLSILTIETYD